MSAPELRAPEKTWLFQESGELFTNKPETYLEQKKRHQDEFSAFTGIFFAFSNDQFSEGMRKLGLEPGDTGKIFSLGAGGYISKERSNEFHALMKRHGEERKQLKKNVQALIDAIVYELQNHEYCITGDPTSALDALDLTIETIDKDILKKAIRKHNELMQEV
jgi:hypothetical protein